MNSQITDPRTGLTARWSLNEGAGTAVNDSAGTSANGTTTGAGESRVAGSLFDIHIDLEGDLGCDCDVDGYALRICGEALLTYNIAADFNGDDIVDAADIGLFAPELGRPVCP